MKSFNLSEWALRHRSLVTYFMLMIVVAGIGSLLQARPQRGSRLHGQDHGRAGGVAGRHGQDTLEQVTDRLERKLQETPSLDYVKSYTSAGRATIFVNLKDSTPPARRAGHLVPGAQEGGRHRRHAAAGRSSAPSSTTSSATPTASSTASPPTASPTASCSTTCTTSASSCSSCRTSPRSTSSAPRTSACTSSSRTRSSPASASTASALIDALKSQNAVTPAGVVQTGDEKILVRVSGAFRSQQDFSAINFVAGRPHDPPGRHRPGHARSRRSGAADVPRQRPARHRHRHRHAQGRRRHGARPQRRRKPWRGSRENLPVGIEPDAGRQPDDDRRARGRRIHGGPVGGHCHRAGRQPAQPGRARRRGGGAVDPAGAGRGVHAS